MFNWVVTMTLTGVLTASGVSYLNNIEQGVKQATAVYVAQARERFVQYDELLPGIVNWQE